MATNNISESLSDEQIIALLQMLFTNMNNLDKLYYDMFINQNPLMLTLERYNADGVIETYQLPNRAMDRSNVLQGRGTPERSQIAGMGTIYIDVLTSNIYLKATEGGATGWIMLYTPANFLKGREYMSPDSDASSLKGISATNITGGILDVKNGGTGVGDSGPGLTGLIKGRGTTQPYTTAVSGVDYIAPKTFIGCLGLFMSNDIPEDWLVCDGSVSHSKGDYPELANALENTFPNNALRRGEEVGYFYYTDEVGNVIAVPEDNFVVPNFQNRYIRGFNSNDSQVLGAFQSCALPEIVGEFFNTQESETSIPQEPTGAFSRVRKEGNGVDGTHGWFERIRFSAHKSNPIYDPEVEEVRVNNLTAKVCIYAGKSKGDVE